MENKFLLVLFNLFVIFLVSSITSTNSAGPSFSRPVSRAATAYDTTSKVYSKRHPLDPLTANEIKITVNVIKRIGKDVAWRFNRIALKEPKKSDLINSFLNDVDPPTTISRRSFAIITDMSTSKIYEVILDLTRGRVESWNPVVTEGQAPYPYLERQKIYSQVLADPQVQLKLTSLGLSNDTLGGEVFDFGYSGDRPELRGNRLFRTLLFYKDSPFDNYLAHPLGFQVNYDETTNKVIEIEDFPIQSNFDTTNRNGEKVIKELFEYDPALTNPDDYRQDETTFQTTNSGPGFKVYGHEIEWQKFSFRIGFNDREGMIIHQVSYNDSGDVRPLIYRASVSELLTTDGDPRPPYHRNFKFLEGQYGLGIFANNLQPTVDCGGSAKFFDFNVADKDGTIRPLQHAVCVFEEGDGILWRKKDATTGRTVTAKATHLVVTATYTSDVNDYKFTWFFYQDASIRMEVQLLGMMDSNFIAAGAETGGHGTKVAENVNIHLQQHLFTVRLDMDVDGNDNNSVATLDIIPEIFPTGSPFNPFGNGIITRQNVLRTAELARTNNQMETERCWIIFNENAGRNPISNTWKGYKLVPDLAAPMLLRKDSPLHAQCEFTDYTIWVTTADDELLYAGGEYLDKKGLPFWVNGNLNASVENTDIVLWHTFAVSKNPRLEDFPIVSRKTIGFSLKPANFFEKNPALDVQPFLFVPAPTVH